MMKTRTLRIALVLFVLFLTIGTDQFTKKLAREHLASYERVQVIGNFFSLTRTENTGAFLSLGNRLPRPVSLLLLSVVPLLVLGWMMVHLFGRGDLTFCGTLAASLIAGGGLGNIWDRMMHGSVTDFMHMDLGLFRTGIFNLADVFIMAGIFLFLLSSFRGKLFTGEQATKP